MKNLFALDVDDDIWQDVGLDESDVSTVPPPWLCDENVRNRIKAMLERNRCVEEEYRLLIERCSLQQWFAEEWKIVNEAITGAGMHFLFWISLF